MRLIDADKLVERLSEILVDNENPYINGLVIGSVVAAPTVCNPDKVVDKEPKGNTDDRWLEEAWSDGYVHRR